MAPEKASLFRELGFNYPSHQSVQNALMLHSDVIKKEKPSHLLHIEIPSSMHLLRSPRICKGDAGLTPRLALASA